MTIKKVEIDEVDGLLRLLDHISPLLNPRPTDAPQGHVLFELASDSLSATGIFTISTPMDPPFILDVANNLPANSEGIL